MRAYPDEWELIQRFAKLVKYGDKDAYKNEPGAAARVAKKILDTANGDNS